MCRYMSARGQLTPDSGPAKVDCFPLVLPPIVADALPFSRCTTSGVYSEK